MHIRVTSEGKTNETTLDEFLSLHDDLQDTQIETINRTLARGEVFHGGDYTSPEFVIEPA